MNRDAIKAARRAIAPVETPVSFGTIHVRRQTVAQVEAASAAASGDNDAAKEHPLAFAATFVVCDEHGALVFDPKNPDDIAELAEWAWDDLKAVLDASNPAAKDQKGAVAADPGNSRPASVESSTSLKH